MDRSRLLDSGTVLAMESLPPWWASKISASLSAVAAELSVAAIASMDTSLSPGARRGHTARGAQAQIGLRRSGAAENPRVAGLEGASGMRPAAPFRPW